jgi:hypothetical protein
MILIPLSLLTLAAGTYLLVYIKQAGFGGLYKYLAWLIVVLSLFFIVCTVVRGIRHHRCMSECRASGQCSMGGHEGGGCCPYMRGGCCDMEGGHRECTKGAEGCSKEAGEGKACCKKGGEEGKAPGCKKDADGAKPGCCMKGAKAAADSSAKK